MQDKDFVRSFYEDIETVAEGFLEVEGILEEDIGDLLDKEFGETSYPIEHTDPKNVFIETSYGLSFLVADQLSRVSDREHFFEERVEDFKEFYRETRYSTQSYDKNELVQLGNLYSALSEEVEAGFEDFSTESLVLKDKKTVAVSVYEFLDDLAEEY